MDCLAAAAEQPACRARKPAGGFRFVSTWQICMVWWAYSTGLIRYRDLRVWFACHETISRRCRKRGDKGPQFTLAELHRLVGGVGGQHLTKSLQRLMRVGLLVWSESAVTFAESPDQLKSDDLSTLWSMFERVGQKNRRVPVPRRTIRLIAGGARKTVTATMLGHLLRCMFYRNGGCSSDGCCKASWVASVFGVSMRQVKAARSHLGAHPGGIGWLKVEQSEHWHKQRWGGRVVVNLAWSRPVESTRTQTESSPRTEFSTTESSPPESDLELSSRLKNQEPAQRGPTGVCKTKGTVGKPTMKHVVASDLSDDDRLLALFEDAQRVGVVTGSEADRLRFVAAAEHARTVGTRNPCGLFVHLVRSKLWHFITQDDENAGSKRLKRYLHGDVELVKPRKAERSGGDPPRLSDDARLVTAVIRVANQHRIAEPFFLLKREKPDWTRERWDASVLEIETSRLRRFQGATVTEPANPCGARLSN